MQISRILLIILVLATGCTQKKILSCTEQTQSAQQTQTNTKETLLQQDAHLYNNPTQAFVHNFYLEYLQLKQHIGRIAQVGGPHRDTKSLKQAHEQMNALLQQHLTPKLLENKGFYAHIHYGRALHGDEANYQGPYVTTAWNLNLLEVTEYAKDEIYNVCYDHDDASGYTLSCAEVTLIKKNGNFLIDNIKISPPMKIEQYQITSAQITRDTFRRAKLQQIPPDEIVHISDKYLNEYSDPKQIFLHQFFSKYVTTWSKLRFSYEKIQQLHDLRHQYLTTELAKRLEIKQWNAHDSVLNPPARISNAPYTMLVWRATLEVQKLKEINVSIQKGTSHTTLYKVCGTYYDEYQSYNLHCLNVNLIAHNDTYLISDIKPLPSSYIYFDQIEKINTRKMNFLRNKRLR